MESADLKKLSLPSFDDEEIIRKLAENNRLINSGFYSDKSSEILENYDNYNNGNPWNVSISSSFSEKEKEVLRSTYKSPPKLLRGILHQIRYSELTGCSMCGGFGSGSLDHVLPKEQYPEFSIFLRNLVPVCTCNSIKSELVKGRNPSERILHPYFDELLSDRILIAKFDGNFLFPQITIENCFSKESIYFNAVNFHFENIVKRTNVEFFFIKHWAQLIRCPERILDTLSRISNVTYSSLENAINKKLENKDYEFGTPNNWKSAFFYGLSQNNQFIRELVDYINSDCREL